MKEMIEIYSWVPWFRELAKKIAKEGEKYLIEKAKAVDWGNSRSLLEYGDLNIDPFSFFYFLAQKNTKNKMKREQVYTSVHTEFGLSGELPKAGRGGFYNHPTQLMNNALFHDGKNTNPSLLWKLFRQAVKDEPDIQQKDFDEALKIPQIAIPKLTRCLFLINPYSFIPVYSPPLQKKIIDWNAYKREVIDHAKSTFSGCRFYEIGQVYWHLFDLKNKPEQNYYQISTKAYGEKGGDYWSDFEKYNWVYTGGGGTEREYPLTEPKSGDIILVRTGKTKGRAIGVVEKNEYAESGGFDPKSKIHVLWINKSEKTLPSMTTQLGFSKAGPNSGTYKAFRHTDSYKPTFEFIESRTKNPVEEDPASYPVSQKQKPKPLNQILYGPPGTGKTWNTVNRALAIIDGKPVEDYEKDREETNERFDELKQAGQIEMVTFHQNYTYEDFIEGIRPVLSEKQKTEDGERVNKSDIKYELSEGIFKRIARCAEKNRAEEKNYVLIIDEINRGNIAKIFGELITLIEESKRLGEKDAATATLPYSKDKEPFGIPNNLYIIGTMNTADRSIALLDTALRRRFDFIEMMPDPGHLDIKNDIEGVNCQILLEKINERIRVLHDRDHQIGHTYFIGVKKMASLAKTFQNQIIPLLQEYFYDNWEKIDLVLNKNGFIQESGVNEGLFKPSEFVDTERKIYELLPANDSKWQEPGSYIEIYETQNQRSKDEPDNKSE